MPCRCSSAFKILAFEIRRIAVAAANFGTPSCLRSPYRPNPASARKRRLDRLQERHARFFLKRAAFIQATISRSTEREHRFIRGRRDALEQLGAALLAARQLTVDREQINARIFGVQFDDVDETRLIAESGDAAFERIFHGQFRRNQRPHRFFGFVAELRQIGFQLVAMIADQALSCRRS